MPDFKSIFTRFMVDEDNITPENNQVLRFDKMHGLGNDFVVINITDSPAVVKNLDFHAVAPMLCNRKTGIGADGIILICSSDIADLRMRIINNDGSEAEMCGNGIRCLAKYAYEHELVSSRRFTVETAAGNKRVDVFPDENTASAEFDLAKNSVMDVSINMGRAEYACHKLPMNSPNGLPTFQNDTITVMGRDFTCTAVLMGVPHLIVTDPGLSEGEISRLGPVFEHHEYFPRGVNVDFVRVIDAENHVIAVRTWERGCGRTLACGTGSCAAAYVYRTVMCDNELPLDAVVTVKLALGDMKISVDGDGRVIMRGPANTVYRGSITMNISE